MNVFGKTNRKRGFSLVEVIIVVAIISILLAVAVPNVIAYYRELKLVELDDSARTIFLAAQNEISAILAADKEGVPAGHDGFCKYSEEVAGGTVADRTKVEFDYLSTTTDADSLHKIVPAGSIESELQRNNYVVEYNQETGAVHAVWYWEGESSKFTYKDDYKLEDTEKSARIDVPVGYYGGEGVDRIAVNQMPFPELTLINAEELQLTIQVPAITGTSLTNNNIMVDVMVNGTPIIKGANLWDGDAPGIVVLDTLKVYPDTEVAPTAHSWTVGRKFKDWVKDYPDIKPGDNITVSVKLYYNGTVGTGADAKALIPQVVSVETNSLFANVTDNGTDKTAEIAYGRHLQNLDTATSGVTNAITAAEQTREIDFAKPNGTFDTTSHTFTPGKDSDDIKFWANTYGKVDETSGTVSDLRQFTAIYNNALKSYDGRSLPIRNLDAKENTDATGHITDAGLFAYIEGAELKDITLINAKVEGDGSVGALIGATTDTVNVSGCKVYLEDYPVATPPAPTLIDPYITSNSGNVGGLIGSAGGTVTISNSFASTIEEGTSNVGGLVGSANATTTITGSYAAGYIDSAVTAGGLVGNVDAAATSLSISNSYAAGIIANASGSAGGLVGNNSASAPPTVNGGSYAAVRYVVPATGATSTIYYGTFSGDMANYYVTQSGVTYAPNSGKATNTDELKNLVKTPDANFSDTVWNVGSGVTNDPANTHAYKLLDVTKDLDTYPYPMLKGTTSTGSAVMPQYGDWLEDVDVEGVMLAYVEQYADNSYGIYAAKAASAAGTDATDVKNKLAPDKIVVDDFYRIVSPDAALGDLTGWKFTLDGDTTPHDLTEDGAHKTIEIGGTTYYCYTLEATGWDSEKNYYHEIKFDGQKLAFIYNASFACEAFDVTEFVYPAAGGTVTVDTATIRSKPEMKSHITIGTLDDTDVFIRSARQLANIQKYTTDTSAPQDAAGSAVGLVWKYDQLADIVFSGADGYTGGGLTVGKESGAPLTPAKLTTGSYYGHEKEIKNLYIGTATDGAGLFESVGAGGSLKDIRLVNVSVAGGDAAATGGLVGILRGTVENCGIYVESGTGIDVDKNYNETWTVTGSGANGVGGLIGDIDNNAEVKLSFAAVKVNGTGADGTGTGPTGGFAGQIHSATVSNCYAGGYVEEDPTTDKLTYLDTSVNVTGGGNVGGFVGSVATRAALFSGIDYSTASVGGPNHDQLGLFAGAVATNFSVDKTAVMLNAVAKAFKAETTGSTTTYTAEAPRDESDYMGGTATGEPTVTAEPYNQTETTFPYPSGQKVHHGDWINVEAMGLYYDTVGGKMGYYANGGNVAGLDALASGTPGNKDYTTNDGYMFVTADDLGEISIRVGEESFLMEPERLTSTMTIDGKDYNYKYEVPAEALNTPTANYYNAVSINGRIFYANFGMACEIFDSVEDPNKPMAKKGIDGLADPYEGIVVRSARQLANIGIRSNVGEYNSINTKVYTKEAEAIQKSAISQVLDIDYAKYAEDTKYMNAGEEATKMPKAVVLDGSNSNANHTPITINGGSYDGHNYEIRNLVPGMIRQITSVSGTTASEVQIQSGLVGRITGGKIENVTLINATVVNNAKAAVDASTTSGSGGGAGGGGGSTGTSVTHTIKDLNWLAGTGVADPGAGNNASMDGKTATYTDANGFKFTVVWGNSGRFEHTNTTYNFDGCNTKCRIYFNNSISSTGNYITFETTHKATVKVWWTAGGNTNERAVSILSSTSSRDAIKTDSTSSGGNRLLTCEVEPGTYYIGCTNRSNYILQVDVIEDITSTSGGGGTTGPTTPTDPGEDKFPEGVDSNKFKVRFGALAGAVNPANKTPNEVTITNCGVYVEPETTPADTDAYTTAYNKYSVQNTATTGFKEDTVGGLIGMATEGTTIDKCYAAVKAAGAYSVGGFIGHLKDAAVSNCYSGGHTERGIYSTTDYNVTANNVESGAAGGFAGIIEATKESKLSFGGVCYSTSSASCPANEDNSDEKGTVGNFAGLIKDTTGNWQGFRGANIYGIGTMNGDNRTDEREYLDRTVTMHAYQFTAISANPYDIDVLADTGTGDPMQYPYQTWVEQTIHHGDWPMRYNLVYYELYKEKGDDYEDSYGNKLTNKVIELTGGDVFNTGASYIGFYGVFPAAASGSAAGDYRVVNTLRVDGYVYKSGYIVVSDADVATMRLDINSYYANSDEREDNPDIDYDANGVTQPTHTTVAQCEQRIDFSKYQILNKDDELKEAVDELGRYGYVLPDVTLNVAASEHFYMDTQINGQTYLFNPQFPYEAVNVDIERKVSGKWEIDYETIRVKHEINYVEIEPDGNELLHTKAEIDDIIVRSALNLAGLTRYSREANNGKVKNEIIKGDFVQHMDIDYNEYEPNTIYDGNTKNRDPAQEKDADKDALGNPKFEYFTGLDGYGQAPAILNGGSYNGLNHTIKNLNLSNDSTKNQYVGLFGQLLGGATVEKLKMENVTVDCGTLGKQGGDQTANVGTLAAVVNDATIRNVEINDVTFNLDDIAIAYDSEDNVIDGLSFEGVGGAIGKINGKATVSNVTITDPTITVETDAGNNGEPLYVGGVIGSADGTYSTYSATATEGARPVSITESGVYISEDNKDDFIDMGVKVTGSVTGDKVGGFAGFLGKGVNVTGDYSAIRVQGESLVGGFAGHIQGSHVENCYSGGYIEAGDYSTRNYNVTAADTSSGTAGGFAGKIEVAYASGSRESMAMYMTGVNYTTSSASGKTVGRFAGEFSASDATALNTKMGAKAPENYAGGKVAETATVTINKEPTVKTGSAMPRQDNKSGFTTVPYNASDDFPYATNLKAHHGDWIEAPLNAAGYWEVEDGLLRLWYIPSDTPDAPVELLEEDALKEQHALGFDHDSRDAVGITESGYFVVSSDTAATFNVPTGLTELNTATVGSTGEKIRNLLGGSTVAVQAYELHSGKSNNQKWTVGGEEFTVNPAYGMAIKHGDHTSEMGTSAAEAYQIRTLAQLQNIGDSNDKHFKQTHDINGAGKTYTSNTNFAGHYDGGFYRILDLTINGGGLFDVVKGDSVFENIILYSPTGAGKITNTSISASGILKSTEGASATIRNCIVAGYTISTDGNGCAGGLVGHHYQGTLTIENCETTVDLSSARSTGGLVGLADAPGTLTITNSYAGGKITGGGSAGGLVGAAGNTATVTYQDVYSYVDMKDSGANTYYGIGPGKVDPKSVLHEYWSTGLDGKTASDADASIKGVSLAQIKLDTQALNTVTNSVSAEEFVVPDATARAKGLENKVAGKTTDADKFAQFPFAAFATDEGGKNYHYGEVPEAQYVGLFYWEKETIKYADGSPAKEEYHYYAHGGEIVDGKLYGQKVLLDSLCYDHHLDGERASITDYGYGVFNTDPSKAVTVKKNGGTAQAITGLIATAETIKKGLISALWPDGTVTDAQAYELPSSTGDAIDEWTLGGVGFTGAIRAYPAFGAAISDKFGNGNDDGSSADDGMGSPNTGIPIQIRTIEQLKNLGSMGGGKKIAYFAITHDIDGEVVTDFKPITNDIELFDGNGYRILDLNIEPTSGNAALFDNMTQKPTIQNVILYSTNGKGEITSTNGNAAGIVAESTNVTIDKCVVAGYTITGAKTVGGIVGSVTGDKSAITNSQAVVNLKGTESSVTNIGGIAGVFRGKATDDYGITNCYAGGTVTEAGISATVGGIAGGVNNNLSITNSYSFMDLKNTGAGNGKVYAICKEATSTDGCYYLAEYLPTGANEQGTKQTFEQMCGKQGDDKAAYVYVPNADDQMDGLTSWGAGAYPMAATVKVGVRAGVDKGVDETGDVLVHYGDWPYSTRAAGIAYYEVAGGEYSIQAVYIDYAGKVKTYKDTLCADHHVDSATGAIGEHKITDSGYVIFSTNKDMKIGTESEVYKGQDEVTIQANRAAIIKAVNEKLKVWCQADDPDVKVYSNANFNEITIDNASQANLEKYSNLDAKYTVTHDGKTEDIYCNPGMSGVSDKAFKGSGNAIEIRTVEQLNNIPNRGKGTGTSVPDDPTSGYVFKQTHDIYGAGYNTYTGAARFAGTYDGQHYKVLDLSMSGKDTDVGLFASINAETCELRNIIMYAPNGATITGTGTEGKDAANDHYGVGGLVGSIGDGGTSKAAAIENCVVAGYQIKGAQYVGGLIGWGYHGADIKNCAAVNDIECTTIAAKNDNGADNCGAGGILGGYGRNSTKQTEITNCYSGGTIKVSGDSAANAVVGGIAGKDGGSGKNKSALVKNCYTYVDLSGCAKAKVSAISSTENSDNKDNYYLNDSARVPAWVHKQGEAKEYGQLVASIFGTTTDFGTASKSYVTKDKSAGTGTGSGMTPQASTNNFPFPALQFNGAYVHYGDWPANNTAAPSSYPWTDGEIGVILGYSTISTFSSSTDVVAQMFNNDHTRVQMIGSAATNKTKINYIGLVLKTVAAGHEDELKNSLKVLYYSSGSYTIDNTGKVLTVTKAPTSFYQYDGKEVTGYSNATAFSAYKLYGAAPGTTIDDSGLLVLVYDSAMEKSSTSISKDNIVGWVTVSDHKTAPAGSSGAPALPDGPEIFDEPSTTPASTAPADPAPTEGAGAPEPSALPPAPVKTAEPQASSEPGADPETQGGGEE